MRGICAVCRDRETDATYELRRLATLQVWCGSRLVKWRIGEWGPRARIARLVEVRPKRAHCLTHKVRGRGGGSIGRHWEASVGRASSRECGSSLHTTSACIDWARVSTRKEVLRRKPRRCISQTSGNITALRLGHKSVQRHDVDVQL